ncbi:MAG: cell division protein FtsA [Prevotellaceae bacterium]|jgi:cell division protein FtsA|nr:cell division protein FtsA [Prevotellaceae bacterium]
MIIVIDLGTTKIVGLVGEKTGNRYQIISYGETVSSGIKHGQVENVKSVVNAVVPVLEEIKKTSGISKIDEVFVGIAGLHIKCIENRTELSLDEYQEITENEILQLEKNARNLSLHSGDEILHIIPRSYIIDDERNITDPVGRFGRKIAGQFYVIMGNKLTADLTRFCMDKLNLPFNTLILEPIASARAVLSPAEKELGVAMIDMGGGTTDLIIYKDGKMKHTAVIPLGGNVITSDIKQSFHILSRHAEQIKIQYGVCIASEVADNKYITIPGIGERPAIEISCKKLACIIEARITEIMSFVNNEINHCKEKLNAGIVFTGGGALLTGLTEFVNLKMGMSVRIGKPQYLSNNSPKEMVHPKYSTAAGLLMCGFDYLDGKKEEINLLNTRKEVEQEPNKKQRTQILIPVIDVLKGFFRETIEEENLN